MRKVLIAAAAAVAIGAAPTAINAAGNLAAPPAERLALGITGTGAALSQTTFDIETGKYYRLTVTSDGAAEVMWASPDLLANAWVNQVVISGLEVKVDGRGFRGVEFDAPGEFWFGFVVIRPGTYEFTVGDHTGVFNVR